VVQVETKHFFTVRNAARGSRHITTTTTNPITQVESRTRYFEENGRPADHSWLNSIGREMRFIHRPQIVEDHILHQCYEFSDLNRIPNALSKQSFVLARSGRSVKMSETQSSSFSSMATFVGHEIDGAARNDIIDRAVRNPGGAQIFDQAAVEFHRKRPTVVSESTAHPPANADGSAGAPPERSGGTHLGHFRSPDRGQSSR
jgi:hypothetical protein